MNSATAPVAYDRAGILLVQGWQRMCDSSVALDTSLTLVERLIMLVNCPDGVRRLKRCPPDTFSNIKNVTVVYKTSS